MRELVLTCTEDQAEAWSEALLAAGALSVALEDADALGDQEHPLFGEPGAEPDVQAWRRNRLVVLLDADTPPAQLLAALDGQAGWRADAAQYVVRDVPDTDWVRQTQAQFQPIVVADRIWIVPSWHRGADDLPPVGQHAQGIRIELDPGLAFGTGSHPTTHLCLEWLAAHLPPGASVLDYGCGSGILAMAASLLGAHRVQGVDIDPQAVESTRLNAQNNHIALQACLPDHLPAGTYDVVLANILSSPLKLLAPMLAGRVAPGGTLVLSGVLARQAQEVSAAYAPWMTLQVWAEREDWVCLVGQAAR